MDQVIAYMEAASAAVGKGKYKEAFVYNAAAFQEYVAIMGMIGNAEAMANLAIMKEMVFSGQMMNVGVPNGMVMKPSEVLCWEGFFQRGKDVFGEKGRGEG